MIGSRGNGSKDLLLRSMSLKCFNRHDFYDMATLSCAKYSPFDRFLFLFRANSSILPSNTAFLDVCENARPVIARNHTRYKLKSRQMRTFFPSLRDALHSSPQHLPRLFSFFPCPGATSDVFTRKRHLYAINLHQYIKA